MKSTSKRARSSSVVSGDDDGRDDAKSTSASTTKRRKVGKSPAVKPGTRTAKAGTSENGTTKSGKTLGSIIGRKRKMRKAKGEGRA